METQRRIAIELVLSAFSCRCPVKQFVVAVPKELALMDTKPMQAIIPLTNGCALFQFQRFRNLPLTKWFPFTPAAAYLCRSNEPFVADPPFIDESKRDGLIETKRRWANERAISIHPRFLACTGGNEAQQEPPR